MDIQDSSAQAPRRLRSEAPILPTAAEMLAHAQQRAAAERRVRLLGHCPADLAAFAAGVSALAYHPFRDVRRHLAREGATDVRAYDVAGSQAVTFLRHDLGWVVFRGSESVPETELFLDWGHDLLCVPWGWPPHHLGFARAWKKIRTPILDWVAARGAERRVVLCGHSLGGALALAAAHDVAAAQLAGIEAVITFGAPRVGTWPWTARYHQLPARGAADAVPARSLREVTWRVHNEGDIVTHVPPLLFAHCGTSISATSLQGRGAGPFGAPPGRRDNGALARVRAAYRNATGFWPYSPVNLLVDVLLFLFETAPEHFMRHYAPAFPERPFADLGEPRGVPPPPSSLNTVLAGVKWLILVAMVAGLAWLGWQAYRLSPEITAGLVLITLAYAIAGYEPPPATSSTVLPAFLRRPRP